MCSCFCTTSRRTTQLIHSYEFCVLFTSSLITMPGLLCCHSTKPSTRIQFVAQLLNVFASGFTRLVHFTFQFHYHQFISFFLSFLFFSRALIWWQIYKHTRYPNIYSIFAQRKEHWLASMAPPSVDKGIKLQSWKLTKNLLNWQMMLNYHTNTMAEIYMANDDWIQYWMPKTTTSTTAVTAAITINDPNGIIEKF